MCGHCIYKFEDLPVLFIFVSNVTFFSMIYHGAVEYDANTWTCVYIIVK